MGGAQFLPFDPGAFAFDARSDLTLASQQASLRTSSPSDAVKELVAGSLPASGYDPAFVPDGWNATPRDARAYRSCHTSFDGALALTHSDDAGPHGMPAAEQTSRVLYASSARAVWLSYLGAAGACAP